MLLIEHNIELIACADWVIDMGPEGGKGGGSIVAAGTPEEVARTPRQPHRPVPQASPRRRRQARRVAAKSRQNEQPPSAKRPKKLQKSRHRRAECRSRAPPSDGDGCSLTYALPRAKSRSSHALIVLRLAAEGGIGVAESNYSGSRGRVSSLAKVPVIHPSSCRSRVRAPSASLRGAPAAQPELRHALG